MNAAAWWRAMTLIGRELCARTCNDHHPLIRFARRPGGITGCPVTGWQPSPSTSTSTSKEHAA